MNLPQPQNTPAQLPTKANSLPQNFAESVELVANFAREEFAKEITEKKLYYHNFEHISKIRERCDRIFQVIRPAWAASLKIENAESYLDRMQLLLDLSAIAHDMLQIFIPQTDPHTPRRREAGLSEAATIECLLNYIKNLNQQLYLENPEHPGIFIDEDLEILREAIAATVCLYDPTDKSIYQKDLYDRERSVSYITRILCLADIGGLGIDNIKYYNKEGSYLFLEENLDIIPIIENHQITNLKLERPELYENLRQRLLKRARFQIDFGRSRLARYPKEVEGLPIDSLPILEKEVFKYLHPKTINELETITPTAENTSLETLIEFFQLQEILS